MHDATAQLLIELEDSRSALANAVAGVTEEGSRRKPAPDRWSVLECLEHVARVEERFLGWLDAKNDSMARTTNALGTQGSVLAWNGDMYLSSSMLAKPLDRLLLAYAWMMVSTWSSPWSGFADEACF